MTLYDELYFEIELRGAKTELKKFVRFLKSGDLDDFFEISGDFIAYDDDFTEVDESAETGIVFTNDDLGVDVDEFNPEDFLDVFCKAAKNLDVTGHFYDIEDEEYSFTSAVGDSGFVSGKAPKRFHDELDEEAYREEESEND